MSQLCHLLIAGRVGLFVPALFPAPLAMAEETVLGVVEVRSTQDPIMSGTAAMLSSLPLIESPFSTSSVAAEDMLERGAKDIADLVEYTPGVSRRSNYWGMNTPSFQFRGFNAGESSAYYRNGFRYQARGPVAMANVESVEVVRGPMSALYGWAEPGGGVYINTKQPTRTPLVEVSLQGDSWGKGQLSADLSGAFGSRGAYRWIVANENGGSFRDRQHLQQTLIAPSLAWDIGEGKQFSLAFERLDDQRSTDYGIPAINGKPADVPRSRVYTEDWGRQHSRSTRLEGRWLQPALDGKLSLGASYYTFNYLTYRDVEPHAVSGNEVLRWYEDYPERYRWITGYIDWARDFSTTSINHHFLGRLEVAKETRSLFGGVFDEYPSVNAENPVYGQIWAPSADLTLFDQSWVNRNVGLVLQDELQSGAWRWLIGTRLGYQTQHHDYTEHLPAPSSDKEAQKDKAIIPRLGVSWRANRQVFLYGNISVGKMPTLPQSRSFDGSSFRPVSSQQVELGIKIQPEIGQWLASLALFDIRRTNALTPDPAHSGYSIQTGEQQSHGIEAALQGRLAPGWHILAQSTWLDAHVARDNRYQIGNRLPYAPGSSTSGWLTHEFPSAGFGRWQLGAGVVYQSHRYADFANTTKLPSYARFDAGLTYAEKQWSATLSMENIADTTYYASGVENRPAVIYPGLPRTTSLKLVSLFY
jgi:iron complex outermembrane receptor protein